jgi:hypothetical protein
MDESQLRKTICDYISTNPKILDNYRVSETIWETDISLDDYVQNMRNPSTWGGALEITAFCNIYKMDVVVHHTLTDKITEFKSLNTQKIKTPQGLLYTIQLHLIYNGNHYEPKTIIKNFNTHPI